MEKKLIKQIILAGVVIVSLCVSAGSDAPEAEDTDADR